MGETLRGRAATMLQAVARHHRDCALVPELTVTDPAAAAAWKRRHDRGPLDAADLDLIRGPQWRRIDAVLFDGQRQRTAIEVKVSRSDYRRETDRKREAWRNLCHRFVYVVPAGLIEPEEVPAGLGLWWVHDPPFEGSVSTVEVKRRAVINKTPDDLPLQLVVALAYRARVTHHG